MSYNPISRILFKELSCILFALILGLVFMPQILYAQLTAEDINQLREQGRAEGWTFTVSLNPAAQRPMEQLCGLEIPPDWQDMATFDPCTPTRALPDSFDWRDKNACTPIKDQGSCGSCWAFSTVAPLESAIKRRFGITVDLSEQWLIDCNTEYYGCYGGYYAHDYHQWKPGKCGGFGAVPEADFPYLEEEGYCNGEHTHPYIIHDWSYIGENIYYPSIESMKQAILDYGPICVSICVNDAFRAYSGGVFNACEDASTNHTVNIVGWDENQGENGVWFIRNSWGTDWGEAGYGRIEYWCSYVGQTANYVEYLPLREKVPTSTETCIIILTVILMLTGLVFLRRSQEKLEKPDIS